MKKVSAKTPAREYYYGLGRRKTSSARVRIYPGKKDFLVNDLSIESYFKPAALAAVALQPLVKVGLGKKVGLSVKVAGGGMSSQAGAIRLGLSRALVVYDSALRTTLKKLGFLRRDSRIKERKKYGLKRARRAPQWSKR